MKNPRKKKFASVSKSNFHKRDESTSVRKVGPKLWLLRVLTSIAAPVLFFVVIEIFLRLIGFGYPTAFFLPSSHDGKKTFIQNNKFGWRFFNPQLARLPYPISIQQTKPPDTIRIFVLGGSAAKGDPSPRFGLPRMLQAMLSLRYPGTHFEVVNAAMTAINSHVVLPIARNCIRAHGDIWVIYMGNNEVVGPFGAGTIFGEQIPPLALIRGSIALKTTRTGQLLDALTQWIQKAQPDNTEWRGMKMFLNQQVREDDPRMKMVYGNFKQNLADIVRAGLENDVSIVVSTVAVNLKDCAPFASVHKPGLSVSEMETWTSLYQLGIKAQEVGNSQEAAENFNKAAHIDDTFAELCYRQGECALALGAVAEAQQHFVAARDFDTLRFRCDSRLNDLIRQFINNNQNSHVLFSDAEHVFAEQSPDGLPGRNLFYEHVHMTFEGNYLLAKTIATKIEKLLPQGIVQNTDTNQAWPSIEDCARRLAWSKWNQVQALYNVLARVSEAPFTDQLNHSEQMKSLKNSLQKMATAMQPAAINKAQQICEAALDAAPDDAPLYAQLASLREISDDFAGAEKAARKEVDLLPSNSEGWWELGFILIHRQKFEDASSAFQQAYELDPEDVWSLQNRAQILAALGKQQEAIEEYHLALATRPHFGVGWLGLGRLLESMGRKTEAEDCYHKALSNDVHRSQDVIALAHFCQSRGWLDEAATNYDEAIQLNPVDPKLQTEAAQNLMNLGHYTDALDHFAEAALLAPQSEDVHFSYGLALGQQNLLPEAIEQFREVLHLDSKMLEARLDLGVALAKQRHFSEALEQFQEVIRQSPTNAVALRYAQVLQSKIDSGETR